MTVYLITIILCKHSHKNKMHLNILEIQDLNTISKRHTIAMYIGLYPQKY